MAAVLQQAVQGRQDQLQGDEAHVHGGEVQLVRHLLVGEIPGVGPLQAHHPGVAAELPGQLAVAHVHGVDLLRAVLQHTVGEAAGGGADVGADGAVQVDGEGGHGLLQLQPAPAHISQGMASHFYINCIFKRTSGLIFLLSVHIYDAGHDNRLRLLPGLRQILFY